MLRVASSRHRLWFEVFFAHAVLAIVAICGTTTLPPDYSWPRLQSMFLLALATSQVALLSTWLTLGSTWIVARLSAMVAAVLFWSFVTHAVHLQHDDWSLVFGMQSFGIVVVLLTLRILGMRLENAGVTIVTRKEGNLVRFTLRQIFSWMAVAAMSITVLIYVARWKDEQDPISAGVIMKAIGLAPLLVILAIVAVWAALYMKPTFRSLLFVLPFLAIAGWAAGQVDQHYRTTWWSALSPEMYRKAYAFLMFSYVAIVYLSLRVFRTHGYRLVKCAKES